MSIMRVQVDDLRFNPYRHIERYQIDEDKIARLMASYAESGFWDGSIQARPHPTKAGKYQIAFGHHRVEAAKRAKIGEVGVVVGQRDNATMLRMMASENAEEFKHSPLVTQETIGAVIEAYAAGEIELEPVSEGEHGGARREVYRVDLPGGKSKPYTLGTVARFLGWVKPSDQQATESCRLAFQAWHAKQDLGIDVKRLQDELRREGEGDLLTNTATSAILTAARTAQKKAKRAGAPAAVVKASAQAAARQAVTEMKAQSRARKTAKEAGRVGEKAAQTVLGKAGLRVDPKAPPPLPVFVTQTADAIRNRALAFIGELQEKVDAILPYRDQLPDSIREGLIRELRHQAQEVAKALNRRADVLEHRPTKNVTQTRRRLTA